MKLSIVFFSIIAIVLVGVRFHIRATATQTPSIKELHERHGIPVSVSHPRYENLSKTITITGNLKEEKRLTEAFQISGRLQSLNVHIGDTVQKGDLIAELDMARQKANLARAKATLAIAQAQLNKATTGARPQERESARAALNGATARLKFAREELVRIGDLVKKEAAPQRQLDQAQSAYENAIAAQEQAHKRLELLSEGTRKEDLAIAKGQVMLAKTQVQANEIELQKHRLLAYLSGIVARAPVDPGAVISTMPSPQTIVEIIKIDPILFECEISELFVDSLSSQTRASITVDAHPGKVYEGRFYELIPKGNLTNRTFTVRFAISNKDEKLLPGMFARGKIALTKEKKALTIPSNLLRDPLTIESYDGSPVQFSIANDDKTAPLEDISNDGGVQAVMIVENGIGVARLVRKGAIVGNRVEIQSGLTAKDTIITEGFAEMKVGSTVNTQRNTQ